MNETVERTITARADVWERWGWVWTAVFYLSLLVPAYLTLNDDSFTGPEQRQVLLLVGFLALWHLAAVFILGPRRNNQSLIGVIYIAVAFTLFFMLVTRHGMFNFILMGLYPHLFILLSMRLAIPAGFILTILAAYSMVAGDDPTLAWRDPFILIFLLMSFVGVALALWIRAIIDQSMQRRELIEALQAAQTELAEAERREGMLAERQRLAREIHDTLAQGFTSIVMHLEAAEQALPAGSATAQQHLATARRMARDSLTEARRVVQDLRPDLLTQDPLPDALARVVARWSEESGIPAGANTTGETQPLHPQVEVSLLRATQEALANVRRHAHAEQVTVTLSYMGDVVMLDVQDDGVGFDPAGLANLTPNANGGFGLRAMRERIQQIGGSLDIETAPGEGTTLVVEVPIER